jgi:hypothetical protein
MYSFTGRHAQVQHQQGHGDGEDSVAKGRQTFHALSGNTVIERVHRMQSSTGGGTVHEPEFGRGESRLASARVLRTPKNGRIWLLAFFFVFFFSLRVWSQDQQNSPAPPPNPPQQASPEKTPENPDDKPADNKDDKKKDEGSNPAQAAAEKTKDVTVQAVEATKGATVQAVQETKQVAQQGLVQLRNWERGWVTGVYVPRYEKLTPLTTEEREQIYLKQTLTSPGDYLKRAFAAGIDQARGNPSQWDGGIKGYSERFASREGQFISANSLAALANAKLGYEVRYDQCRCSGFWPRTRHAIMRNFLTYNRSEEDMRPQLGLYAGSFGGGVISTAWKPHPRNAFAEGGRAMAGQAAYGALLNIFTEFAVDINRKLGSSQ